MPATTAMANVYPLAGNRSRVDAVIRPWLASLDSEQTRAAYRRAVELAFKTIGRTDLDRVTTDDIAAFKASQQGKAASTVALRLSALKSFFAYAVAAGHARVDPTRVVKIPKVNPTAPRALSLAQARRIVEAISPRSATGMRDRAAVSLLFLGLRVSEVVGLNVKDVRLENQGGHEFTRIEVRHGKGNKARSVDAPRRAFELVQACLAVWPASAGDDGPVFVGAVTGFRRAPGRLTADGLYRAFCRYAKRAGVKITGSHAARHTWALAAEQAGARVADIAAALGHANLGTTSVYLKRLVGARNPASDAVPVLA
jgi:site-specific recombinase XerD